MKKIAIITGAAGGIGAAIAERCIADVDALLLVDIEDTKLELLRTKLNKLSSTPVSSYHCDVGNSQSVADMINAATQEIGIPTILVNNAGIGGPFHRVDEVGDEEWYRIINTNLKSVFNFSRLLLPMMKQLSYGRIINIASVQGLLGAALSSTYVASKHGMIGYTQAIATEWGQYGITCNAICPGYVDTAMGVQDDKVLEHYKKVIAKTPEGRIAKPIEIADLVNYLMKDEASFINGSVLTIDGGLTCHVGI